MACIDEYGSWSHIHHDRRQITSTITAYAYLDNSSGCKFSQFDGLKRDSLVPRLPQTKSRGISAHYEAQILARRQIGSKARLWTLKNGCRSSLPQGSLRLGEAESRSNMAANQLTYAWPWCNRHAADSTGFRPHLLKSSHRKRDVERAQRK